MRVLKVLLGAGLLAVTAWILTAVFAPSEPEAEPMQFTSSRQCAECHAQVYAEWERSWHSRAWVDPDVLALSENFSNTDCIDCHAPRPVFFTGIGNRVLPRSSRRAEGVDCIACHALPGGGVAGTIDDPTAPCRPVATIELQKPEFCAGCHNQHNTVDQWRESRYPDLSLGCLECHMPYRDDDPARGRDHLCMGAHDLELVKSAVELRGVRERGRWVIEVENVAAGHSYPTDERSRASDVFWRPLVGEGEEKPPWKHAYRFRSPYRYEVDIVDTLLLAGENRRIPLNPDGTLTEEGADGAIEVALFYKLSPYYTDPENPDPEAEARLVHTVELVP